MRVTRVFFGVGKQIEGVWTSAVVVPTIRESL